MLYLFQKYFKMLATSEQVDSWCSMHIVFCAINIAHQIRPNIFCTSLTKILNNAKPDFVISNEA